MVYCNIELVKTTSLNAIMRLSVKQFERYGTTIRYIYFYYLMLSTLSPCELNVVSGKYTLPTVSGKCARKVTIVRLAKLRGR